MIRKLKWLMVILSIFVVSCPMEKNETLIEKYKTEIMDTEKAFAKLVKEKGMKVAFVVYAANNAVLNRGENLIKGKEAIQEYYENYKYPNARLEWEPDFIDVSSSGDLAYTYGHYLFEAIGDSGMIINNAGIFHTIWKRESNGKWRYVWD